MAIKGVLQNAINEIPNIQTGRALEIICQELTGKVSKIIDANNDGDLVNVKDIDILFVDTSSGNVTIGGFINVISGQTVQVVVTDASGNTTIENDEGGGGQEIATETEGDLTLTATFGGWTFICNGTAWFQVGGTTNE